MLETLWNYAKDRRGIYIDMKYLDENRVTLIYEMPLNEIIYDFFDNLKSKTKGYASLDYEFKEYKKSEFSKIRYLYKWRKSRCIKSLLFIKIVVMKEERKW